MLNIQASYKPDMLKGYSCPGEATSCVLIEYIPGSGDHAIGSFLALSSNGQRFFTDYINRFTYEGKGWLD